jgi:post-segregation antitoxin (ccd killing protein)
MKTIAKKQEMQKVTVMLPRDLVERAKRVSGLGITPAIRQGLEAVAATDAYEAIRRLRGKVKFSISLNELRGK